MDTKQSLANVIIEAIEAAIPEWMACRTRTPSPECWNPPEKKWAITPSPALS